MSNPEDKAAQSERAVLKNLEGVVNEVLERLGSLHQRATGAEAKNSDMEELLRRFTGDEAEAGRMLSRLKTLEAENVDLRKRLEKGREGVERLLAKIRFLEEQR